MTMRKLSTLASAAALGLVAACSSEPTTQSTIGQSYPTSTYPSGAYTMQTGRVSNIEVVDGAHRAGLGTVLGAVVGGALGNQVGSGSGRTAATVGGAVAGGVIGNQIEKRNANDVFRVTVHFDNGAVQTFNYDRIDDLRVGDRVRFDGRQLYRA
jgi:outer membrane lipoprotein SlyB